MTKYPAVTHLRAFSRLATFSILTAGVFIATGCSLVKIESPNDPIPRDEMNVRLATNDFAVRFAETVEHAADTILAGTTDLDLQLNALRWKINAFGAIRHASFRPAPREALVDTWVLTSQMHDFFKTGAGRDVFGEWQAYVVAECDTLLLDVTAIAFDTRSADEFARMQEFVTKETDTHPFADLTMYRPSAIPNWRDYMAIADSSAVPTVGTLPQVMTQVGTGVLTLAEHTPKEARWTVELARKKSRIDSLQLAARLDHISALLSDIAAVAQDSPEILSNSIGLLGLELEAVLTDVNAQRSATLVALAEEREAVIDAVERERAAILAGVDQTIANVTDTSLGHVRGMVKDALFVIVVVLIILLVGPFVMGYMLAKARTRPVTPS